MNLELDTINKTVTLKSQSFKIDDLILELDQFGIRDWTININGIYYYNSPQIYPYGTINCGSSDPNPIGPCFTTSDTAPFPLSGNISFTK